MNTNKILPLAILSVITIFCYACANTSANERFYYNENNSVKFDDKYDLKEVSVISFPLDTSTGFYNYSLEMFYDKDSARHLVLFNELNHSLYMYDYDRRTLERKITFQREGPNGIGNYGDMGFHVLKNEQILLFNYWEARLLLANYNGEVLKRIDLKPLNPANRDFASKVNANLPLIEKDNKVYIFGDLLNLSGNYDKVRNMIEVNLDDFKIRWLLPFPTLYNDANWGQNSNQLQASGVYNPEKGKFIVNFSASPYLYETDLQQFNKEHYAGSKYFKSITPLSGSTSNEYKFTTPAYRYLYYDPFGKMYYRKAFIPFSKADFRKYSERDLFQKIRHSIIMIDTAFNKTGEVILDRDLYDINMLFFSREGLNIANLAKYNQNEDSLYFSIFKPELKK